MVSAKAVIVIFTVALVYSYAVSAAQPALPTTFYGRVVYANNTPAQGLIVEATWTDNKGATTTSQAVTLTLEKAVGLGHPEFVGYYFFNNGFVHAQEGTPILLRAIKSVNREAIEASPGSSPKSVQDLVLADVNDKILPKISNVDFTDSITFTTDEIATSAVRYGIKAITKHKANYTLTSNHKVFLSDLLPYATYIYEVSATDIAGNTVTDDNNGAYYTLSTGGFKPTPNKPGSQSGNESNLAEADSIGEEGDLQASSLPTSSPNTLPTSLYGQVKDDKGEAVEDTDVVATFTLNGETHSLKATTINKKEAEKLGDPSLAGYYFFRQNLSLPHGTQINITSEDTGTYQATASANPGGISKAVITKTFLAPKIKISKPERVQSKPSKPEQSGKDSFNLKYLKQIGAWITVIIIALLIFKSIKHYQARTEASQVHNRLNVAIKKTVEKSAGDVMTKNVLTLDSSSSLEETASLLLEREIGGIVVVDSNNDLKGWVTEQSITRDILINKKPLSTALNKATMIPLVIVTLNTTLFDVNSELLKSKARKAVVYDNNKLVGVISFTDIAKALSEFYARNTIESESLPTVANMLTEPTIVSRSATLLEVKCLMQLNKVDYVIVNPYKGSSKGTELKAEKPAGIITERDLLGEVYINRMQAEKIKASFAIKAPIKTIKPYFNAFQANDEMLAGFRRLAVFRDSKVRGVLTQEAAVDNIMNYLKRISGMLKKGDEISVSED